jgi:hypothetical protein
MDQRDRADSTEPTLAAEPTDHRQATDPADPIDRMEPADPIDRIEPADPIDRIDPVDPMLRIEPDEPPAFGAWPFVVMPTSSQLLPGGAARPAGDRLAAGQITIQQPRVRSGRAGCRRASPPDRLSRVRT